MPKAKQPVGIELDADLAIDAAVALDAADALRRLQLALDDVVDVPGELLERHARRGGRIGQDRLALDVDALDDRLVDRRAADHARLVRSRPSRR